MSTKRLQVLINDSEYRVFHRLALRVHLSLGEWVRQAMREFAANFSLKESETKIKALRLSAKQSFPSGEIDDILSQISLGYTS